MPEKTFFSRRLVARDGKQFFQFDTGPLGKTGYTVHRDGSVRHTYAQFRGSKKNRLRYIRAVRAALALPIPEDHKELGNTDKLEEYDQLFNVFAGIWAVTPIVGATLDDIQRQTIAVIRACRPI